MRGVHRGSDFSDRISCVVNPLECEIHGQANVSELTTLDISLHPMLYFIHLSRRSSILKQMKLMSHGRRRRWSDLRSGIFVLQSGYCRTGDFDWRLGHDQH